MYRYDPGCERISLVTGKVLSGLRAMVDINKTANSSWISFNSRQKTTQWLTNSGEWQFYSIFFKPTTILGSDRFNPI